MTENEIRQSVVRIVAEALDHDVAAIHPWSSLIDDLGAESIDFLDIQFRIESQFGIKVPGDEIWAGSFGSKSPGAAEIAEGIRTLRQRMPEFRWDRVPDDPSRADLPRLITVNTIVEYLDRRLSAAPA